MDLGVSSAHLVILLIFLILTSALFSGSETAMMTLNRYRLKHQADKGNKKAKVAQKLLQRPDRLLGIILIGNTVANVFAASVVTVLAVHLYGQAGVVWATLALTLVLLVVAETLPKTLAAHYSEGFAYKVVWILHWFLRIFYPLVWFITSIANFLLRCFRVKIGSQKLDILSMEELGSMVDASSQRVATDYRHLLKRVLDMEQATVEDVMTPRHDINGIDIAWTWAQIITHCQRIQRDHIVVYQESIDNLIGILHIREFWQAQADKSVSYASADSLTASGEQQNKKLLLSIVKSPYFIPESTLLSKQFLEFKRLGVRVGFVVDEYGDVLGIISVRDIISEIVGGFKLESEEVGNTVSKQDDGSYIILGQASVRDVNRWLGWRLPVHGPKTISGMIVEALELIPEFKLCVTITSYRVEVLTLEDNTIKECRIWTSH